MSTPTLRDLADSMKESAWMNLTHDGYLVPAWLFVGEDGNQGLVVTPWESSDEKAACIGAVAGLVGVHRSQVVVGVCDIWMRTMAADAPDDGLMPHEAMDAVEAVLIIGGDKDGNRLVLFQQYRRADDGTFEELELIDDVMNSMSNSMEPIFQALERR